MANGSLVRSSFLDGVLYALKQLQKEELVLKEERLKAIRAVYDRRDVFVLLPTGFGKNVCFHVIPFVFDHKLGLVGSQSKSVVVVVLPLVALMQTRLEIRGDVVWRQLSSLT